MLGDPLVDGRRHHCGLGDILPRRDSFDLGGRRIGAAYGAHLVSGIQRMAVRAMPKGKRRDIAHGNCRIDHAGNPDSAFELAIRASQRATACL